MEPRFVFRQPAGHLLDQRRAIKDAIPSSADLASILEGQPVSRCFCFGKFGSSPLHAPVRKFRRVALDQPICSICNKVKAVKLQVLPVASQETIDKQCTCDLGKSSPRYSAPLSMSHTKKRTTKDHLRGKSETEMAKHTSDKGFPVCTPAAAVLRLTPISKLHYSNAIKSSLLDVQRLRSSPNPCLKTDIASTPQATNNSLNMSLPLPHLSESNSDRQYVVYPGNNSQLIRRLMRRRKNWTEGKATDSFLQFAWHPTSRTARFDRLVPYQGLQMVNHFECHWELTNKLCLFRNLKHFCESNQMDIRDFMPLTFSLEFESKRFHVQYNAFTSFFKNLADSHKKGNKEKTVSVPATHDSGENVWLLKPSGFNRGIGICVFSSLEEFKTIVEDYHEGLRAQSKSETAKNRPKKPRSARFVIQKYIEKPLLLHQRKFDIRMWSVLTQDSQGYLYREGYLRTSSESFTLDKSLLGSQYVHLTNNAVQKYGPLYGKFESGNQVSFAAFQSYLDQAGLQLNVRNDLIPKLKQLVRLSLSAVFPTQTVRKLNPLKRSQCFELFGYDFIMDEDLQPWLIEVNTNPCLELSSPLLEQLIPAMLDDMLKLTVDRVFPTEICKDLVLPQVVEMPMRNNWEHVGNLAVKGV